MSQSLKIQGLAGKRTLEGTVRVNGAKNAVLKAIAAAFLFKDTLNIENVPKTEDVLKLLELVKRAGGAVVWAEDNALNSPSNTSTKLSITAPVVDSPQLSTDLDPVLAEAMRASVVLTGPILARYGKVSFSAPGGCVIGARPVDIFVWAYQKMGAVVEQIGANYVVTAPQGRLKGSEIFFPIQTVGGTETIMMAAVLAEGVTILKNCAMEPEIQSLAEFLVLCGARIEGIGTTTLKITGINSVGAAKSAKAADEEPGLLTSLGNPYVTIPDRIEAGSFLLLAACCGKNILIENCNLAHMESITHALIEAGVPLEIQANSVRVNYGEKESGAEVESVSPKVGRVIKSFNVRTHEYPGFATDLQPQAAVFLTQAEGDSTIFETIFEGRFKFVNDIVRMGADITVMNPREILIKGPKPLKALPEGERLLAHDIRAGFAIVMAALLAEGTSVIDNVHLIDRGYEKIEERLRALGVKIDRV